MQSCRGSCKASTAFCPEASLKGHKPAEGLCREFSEWKCRAGGAGSFRFPSHRPEVLPGVNFPLRKVDYKNCLANSSPDILGRMLSPQQLLKEVVCQAAESRDCCTRTKDKPPSALSCLWHWSAGGVPALCCSMVAHLRPVIKSSGWSQLMLQSLQESCSVDFFFFFLT